MQPWRAIRRALLAATALTGLPLGGAWADDAKWGPWIDAGGKIGSKRDIGEVDVFLPLAQDDRRLLFVDLRGIQDDQHQREGNFGLGYRQMLDSGWNLGGYGFFDRRRSATEHYFSQATLGLEALGADLDVRANGYLPLGTREYEIPGSTRIDMAGASIRMSNSYERAYHGSDAELGWRVPLFAAEDDAELRLYGGGYWFDAPRSDSVAGPRLRLELRLYDLTEDLPGPRLRLELRLYDLTEDLPGSRLTLSGEVQHDEPRGTQEFVGFKLRLPLQPDPATRRLTPQERRMVDPVVRDVDIVTQQAQVAEAVKVDGQAIAAVKTLSGANLQAELNAADGNTLLLLDGVATVNAPLILAQGKTLSSGGSVITLTGASSGRTIAYTTPGGSGTIKGAVAGDAVVKMADGSTLRNVTVENTDASAGSWAVSASGVSGARLENATLVSARSGLSIANSDNFTVTGGSIHASQGDAISVSNGSGLSLTNLQASATNGRTLSLTGAAGATITGNTLQTSTFGGNVALLSGGTDNVFSNNRLTYGGIQGAALSLSAGTGIDVFGNTIQSSANGAQGIYVNQTTGSIRGNTVTTNGNDNGANAHALEIRNGGGLTVSGNTLTTNGRNATGLYVNQSAGISISGNTVTGTNFNGRALEIYNSANAEISGNTLASTTLDDSATGFYTQVFTLIGDNNAGIRITDNAVSSRVKGAIGIYVRNSNNATVSGNTVTTQGSDAYGTMILNSQQASVTNNTITTSGSGAYGIRFWTNSYNSVAENNTVRTAAGTSAVRVESPNAVTVRNNHLVGQGDSGVSGTATVSGNTP